MQPALASVFVFEVLHRVGHVDAFWVDASLVEAAPEHPAGGADEGPSLSVFLIARLLTDEDERGLGRSLTEDGLGGVVEERTSGA